MTKLYIDSTSQFRDGAELKEKIHLLMFHNAVKKTDIAIEFQKRGLIGATYPTILKKLKNPAMFKFGEMLVLCSVLSCNLQDLLIKKTD